MLRNYIIVSLSSHKRQDYKIFFDKISIYFDGASFREQEVILNILGFVKGDLSFKYLGVPLIFKKLSRFWKSYQLNNANHCLRRYWEKSLLGHQNCLSSGRIHLIKNMLLYKPTCPGFSWCHNKWWNILRISAGNIYGLTLPTYWKWLLLHGNNYAILEWMVELNMLNVHKWNKDAF